jgi:hypothetical protein
LTLDQLSDGYQTALAMATGIMGPLSSMGRDARGGGHRFDRRAGRTPASALEDADRRGPAARISERAVPRLHTRPTYLDFVLLDDDAKRKALIRPKGQRGRRRQLGERSIDVYSLNRPLLVDRRRRELTQLQRHLADFKLALEIHEALPAGELRERQAQLMQSSVASIAERLSPDSEYLLMAKQALADFVDANPAVRRALERALRDARRTS